MMTDARTPLTRGIVPRTPAGFAGPGGADPATDAPDDADDPPGGGQAEGSGRGPGPGPGQRPGPGRGLGLFVEIAGVFLLSLILLIVLSSVGQLLDLGPLTVAISEIFAVLLPALLWSHVRLWQVLRGLRLAPIGWPAVLSALGGLLVGFACCYALSLWVEPLCDRLRPMTPAERAYLMKLLLPKDGPRPLWQDLLCFAAMPALCEEILFRGVLLPTLVLGFRPLPGVGRAPRAFALLGSAVLFGAFHCSLAKLLPTTLLGLGFGAAAIASGSLWASIAMHFANNSFVLVLVRAGLEGPPAPGSSGAATELGLAALGAFLVGLMLFRSGRARPVAVSPPPLDRAAGSLR